MNPKTNTNSAIDWKMEDLYDLLMYDVDQELLLKNISKLKGTLESLPEKERKRKIAKYQKSMKKFMKKFDRFMVEWHGAMKKFYKQKMKEAEKLMHKMELGDLDEKFNKLFK